MLEHLVVIQGVSQSHALHQRSAEETVHKHGLRDLGWLGCFFFVASALFDLVVGRSLSFELESDLTLLGLAVLIVNELLVSILKALVTARFEQIRNDELVGHVLTDLDEL